MIGLRADGGARAGLGHLGRCLALAQAFERLGRRPVFVGVPAECRGWVAARGFRCAPSVGRRWDILVADSYRFTAADLRRMRSAAKSLVLIDDFGTASAPCDWVLNGHLYAPSLRYRAPAGAGLLLGPKFHPMGRSYWAPAASRRIKPRVADLLVTLGGGDAGSLLTAVVRDAAAALPRTTIHVVLGPVAKAGPLWPGGERVVRYPGVPSLRPLFERCDLAVSAAGQTLYEAACLGTPTVAVRRGPDQRGNFKSMTEAGAAVAAARTGDRVPGLSRLLCALDADPVRRRDLSERGRALLDGQGALRVARVLLDDLGRRKR